jgi:hypothetical protein
MKVSRHSPVGNGQPFAAIERATSAAPPARWILSQPRGPKKSNPLGLMICGWAAAIASWLLKCHRRFRRVAKRFLAGLDCAPRFVVRLVDTRATSLQGAQIKNKVSLFDPCFPVS